MSKMGMELDKRLEENKYAMWEVCKYYNELHGAFNAMLGMRAKDEDVISMLDSEMDKLGAIAGYVLAKIEGNNG